MLILVRFASDPRKKNWPAKFAPRAMATRIPNEHSEVDDRANGKMSIDSEKTREAGGPDLAEEVSKPVDVPPDGGYGWVCTACVFLINAHTWGVNSVCHSTLIAEPLLTIDSPTECFWRIIYPTIHFPAQRHSNMHS